MMSFAALDHQSEIGTGDQPLGFLVNPLNPRTQLLIQQMREPARSLGLSLDVLEASTEGELDTAFASTVQRGVGALLVAQEPSYNRWHEHIVALAARHKMPSMYASRIYAVAGGLMTYDASVPDSMRQVGVYVGRILKGEKPADLPVQAPTKVRVSHKSQDRQGARPRSAADASRPRRRGDRMM